MEKKIVKQITFQRKAISILNKDTDLEEVIAVIPKDRVLIRYVQGKEADLIQGDALVETQDSLDTTLLIKKSDMSSGNPNGYDLSTVGSQELLTALLAKIDAKINV